MRCTILFIGVEEKLSYVCVLNEAEQTDMPESSSGKEVGSQNRTVCSELIAGVVRVAQRKSYRYFLIRTAQSQSDCFYISRLYKNYCLQQEGITGRDGFTSRTH